MKIQTDRKPVGSLDGIRILDLSIQVPGPYCSMLLGDLGAEVIKIEQPGIGDFARLLPLLYNSINRNKKSLILDLKSPEGKKIFQKLAMTSDVILEGFRPGVMAALGIDYKTLSEIRPEIIYCSITGYGQNGPYRDVPGHDINYLGVSGLLSLQSESQDYDTIPDLPVADISGSMFATVSILSALISREKTGKGQYIDVSMTAGVFSWMSASLSAALGNKKAVGNVSLPHYGIFSTKDGGQVTLGIIHEDHFWKNLCGVIDVAEMGTLGLIDRITRREEILAVLKKAFLEKTRDEWVKILTAADVPCGPVLSVEESYIEPQFVINDLVFKMAHPVNGEITQRDFPVRFSETKLKRENPPPLPGQNTDEILAGIGYSMDEINVLKRDKIVK